MYIGLGIVLLVVGAILAFDVVTVNIAHVNAEALGVILMVGGALAILLSFAVRERYFVRRREVVSAPPVVAQPVVQPPVVVEAPPVVDDRRI